MKRAFLTGCGSGFGHTLAQRLLAHGWQVVATDVTLPGLADLNGAERHALDVRDAAQVRAVAQAVTAAGPIDLLVNNGGYALFNTLEDADLDAVSDLFDVNVLGVARVTQALLPALRAAQGTVVNLSSVAGRMVFPESGFYAATKYAVEALSEALYVECAAHGVNVVVVEPGSFNTAFLATAQARSRPRHADSPSASLFDAWDRRKLEVLQPPQDPALVAEAIHNAVDSGVAFVRVPVGPDAERLMTLRDALTPDAFARLYGWRFGAPDAGDGSHDVLSAANTLRALADDPTSPRLTATRAALAAGHLTPWADDAVGRHALAALGAP